MTITHTETFFRPTALARPVAMVGGVVGVWPTDLRVVRVARVGGVEVLDYGTLAAFRRTDGVVDVWVTGVVPGERLLMGVDTTGVLAFFSEACADEILVYDLVRGIWVEGGELPRFVLGEDGARAWVTDLEQGWQYLLIEAVDADRVASDRHNRLTA